jgi:hypothetical protein
VMFERPADIAAHSLDEIPNLKLAGS